MSTQGGNYGEHRQKNNDELYEVYEKSEIAETLKSCRLRCGGQWVRVRVNKITCRVTLEQPFEEKRQM